MDDGHWNLKVVRCELNIPPLYADELRPAKKLSVNRTLVELARNRDEKKKELRKFPSPPKIMVTKKTNDASTLLEELLCELYGTSGIQDRSNSSISLSSAVSTSIDQILYLDCQDLETLGTADLLALHARFSLRVLRAGAALARRLRARDQLRRTQRRLCSVVSTLLMAAMRTFDQTVPHEWIPEFTQEFGWYFKAGRSTLHGQLMRTIGAAILASAALTSASHFIPTPRPTVTRHAPHRRKSGARDVRFAVSAGGAGGASGANGAGGDFAQWLHAMRLVARMPAGVPTEFRRKLWLTLATRHLEVRGVRWSAAERACFSDTTNPDDAELAVQIVKDLHRTGCSLFCGVEGRENQAMLRRVLLAYARWNKEVGYCQGFNMLAAIILEVMDRNESDSLKVMIYLVEGVLPPGYFADELRGLSADMAAFRDLLRARLPRLHAHLERLQHKAQGDGGSYEPPLPDVFTMQWFLTLYATWLPRSALLRVWDLAMLDGGDVLLTTALVIWEMLQDRILRTRSADEFYCAMGAVAAGGAAAGALDTDLLATRVAAARVDDEAVRRARERRRYEVAPFAAQMQSAAKKSLRLFYSDDEGDSSDEANKMALTSTFVMPALEHARGKNKGSGASERLSLDIGALKRQYARLRERQRQAHVILAAACARHAAVGVPTTPSPLSVNHLLLGKSAIVSNRGRRLGPPPGTVPPSRTPLALHNTPPSIAERKAASRRTSAGNKSSLKEDTMNWNVEHQRKSLYRRDSIKWKDIKPPTEKTKKRKGSFDFEESGDGTIVTENEARDMMTAIRPRTKSESSSYSDCSGSSTSTSLCDEPNRMSDFDFEPGSFNDYPEKDDILDCKEGDFRENSKVSNIVSYVQEFEQLLDKTKEGNTKQSENIQALIDKTLDEINFKDKLPTDPVGKFVESTPGAPLRDYINEFKTVDKLAAKKISSTDDYIYYHSQPFVASADHVNERYSSSFSSSIKDLNYSSKSDGDILISTKVPPRDKYEDASTSSHIEDVSPVYNLLKISSDAYYSDGLATERRIPYVLNKSLYESKTSDIIESLIKSPNFIPDIELSDKHVSDIDEHLRSLSPESIAISEDEPPIPLKIDKYFEHSPEFFGARKSGPDISSDEDEEPERSSAKKRQSRQPKKPNSLLLQSNYNGLQTFGNPKQEIINSPIAKNIFGENQNSPNICERERIHHSLPDGIASKSKNSLETINTENTHLLGSSKKRDPMTDDVSLSDPQSSRRNSERALLIIQENSKILNRILTKQIASSNRKPVDEKKYEVSCEKPAIDFRNKAFEDFPKLTAANLLQNCVESERRQLEISTLKGSVSDTLIKEKLQPLSDNKHSRNRPLSLDDKSPIFANFIRSDKKKESELCVDAGCETNTQTNKTDLYGWENKAFVAKRDCRKSEKNISEIDVPEKSQSEIPNITGEHLRKYSWKSEDISLPSWSIGLDDEDITDISKVLSKSEYSRIHSMDIEGAASSHSARRIPISERADDFHPKSLASLSKYDDRHISSISDSRYKVQDGISKSLDIPSKAESSQLSDFAFVVTSSISFSYDPSTDDTNSTAGKSNSSDTLCQITSLDQISTPISPKIFPTHGGTKDSYVSAFPASPLKSGEIIGELEKLRMSSDNTSSAITSMTDTETMSSFSLKTPTSPSSSRLKTNTISPDKVLNPFPTRGPFQKPKELGIRLGMYARDPLKSPSK